MTRWEYMERVHFPDVDVQQLTIDGSVGWEVVAVYERTDRKLVTLLKRPQRYGRHNKPENAE